MAGGEAMAPARHMRWWGWGDEAVNFDPAERPGAWPYLKALCGIEGDGQRTPPVPLESIRLPPPVVDAAFLDAVRTALTPARVRTDAFERLVHAYGKGYRDLWRIRRGIVERAPDAVLYPEAGAEVVAALAAAEACGTTVIPFGGGTNIAGCLEARAAPGRMVASLDMRCMARVLEVNPEARTARAEAGILGPALERALNARSLTLGHFPDSFLYSTLGGWVATRSAGMQSDKYGNIEDMVVSLGLVTPRGTLRPRDVPRSSAGPDLRQLGLGSEGTLGVITDVTIRVHEMPDARCFEAWLFPDFASGVEAMRECRVRGRAPMMMRLNDPGKTALSMAFKTNTSRIEAFVSKAFGMYLARLRRFPMPRACLLVAGFEGTAREVRAHRRDAARIYARHGAVGLGAGPGRAMERAKYDFPCARDFLMDRNIMGDVSETSTAWSNILPLYDAVTAAIRRAATEVGTSLFLGCHISHSYHAGASLYFTFAGEHRPGEGDEFAQYLRIKRAAQDAFLRYGGTLSHHHAVGTEHLPWLAEELGPAGLEALAALRRGLDPRGVMNPGKLGRDGAGIEVWDHAPRAAVAHPAAAAAAPIA